MIRKTPAFAIGLVLSLVAGTGLLAQGRGGRGGGRGADLAKGTDVTSGRNFDMVSVDRGKAKFAMLCASCHGEDSRGGAGKTEVDLVRSVLVLDDVGGKELGEFLKTGRPAKKMPAFTLTPEEVSDIAAFLHYNVTVASERGAYKYLNVLVGDPKAGEAYFNGAGGCTKCHSVTGDLKGIGAKYDPPGIQLRVVTGGGGGRGRGNPATEKTATVTLADGKIVSGTLVQITPFSVTVRDASGTQQKFDRNGDNPKVLVTDPLQAHLDLMRKYTDEEMHNLTAYLATLK
ncbi:MAG TPA: c-type cytochrome [Bryobacteraceae bacterium]|nr:c-type cytochrome [Bryobacteraceae bacterium]